MGYNAQGAILESVLEARDNKYEAAELDAGILLLGRGALKEYLWALRKGWGEDIDLREEARLEGLGLGAGERRKDGRWEREEAIMTQELDNEDIANGKGPFDVSEVLADVGSLDDAPESETPLSLAYAPYRSMATLPTPEPTPAPLDTSSPLILPAPDRIPPQPPLLLVPFHHPFGVRNWPSKLLRFFNRRADVKLGGEYALTIINAKTRPFESPTARLENGQLAGVLNDELVNEVRVGKQKDLAMEDGVPTGSKDLDFLFDLEEVPTPFRKTYRTLPSAHEYASRTYYTADLPKKLTQARELAGGRTPTKGETNYPPKMEHELRKERLEKELKWRRELEGWALRRSGSGVAWDEKWGAGIGSENPFSVYVEMNDSDRAEMAASKQQWDEALKEKRAMQEEQQ